ncbi:MAG: CsbD family protein [Parvibaculum sp.]|nr:CsbD family protein [Parvibaculum sp.]
MVDKDRIAGAGNQIKGSIKEAVGKVAGDPKLEIDGKADKAKGKIQSAIGGMKDAAKR